VRLKWLAALAVLAGCATATARQSWIEQNSVRGLVLTQTIAAGAGETFLVCRTLENRGPRRAYVFDGIEHRVGTTFYTLRGEIDPPDVPGHSSRVPPPYPSDESSFTELGVGYRLTDCGTFRYDSAHADVFIVQATYESPLSEGSELAARIAVSIASGTNERPLTSADADALYSNRCRVDRRRRQATCDASLAN
jgi:hypothetical protein